MNGNSVIVYSLFILCSVFKEHLTEFKIDKSKSTVSLCYGKLTVFL